jgi:hypothetical protein
MLPSACAHDPGWQRKGATAADLDRERKECFQESGNTSGVMNWKTSRYVERCLEERGWTRGGDSAARTAPPEPTAAAPAEGRPTRAPSEERMSFDECFERCRALTDRTKEACFDTCLPLR